MVCQGCDVRVHLSLKAFDFNIYICLCCFRLITLQSYYHSSSSQGELGSMRVESQRRQSRSLNSTPAVLPPSMHMLLAGILILVCDVAVSCVRGAQFAVIAAGSNGWSNYRHQSDACHAYALLRENGVPPENIVVMLYDDVAFAPENPYPGVLINDPRCLRRKSGPGEKISDDCNVYKGCQKDYTGDTVTPENFLKVLRGDETVEDCLGKNATCNGRTLSQATDKDEVYRKLVYIYIYVGDIAPNEKFASCLLVRSFIFEQVFVAFFDHGGAGVLFFPNFVPLVAQDFVDVLKKMHKDRKYKQMAIYIEACNSGSLFNHLLPKDIDVYAVTAAAPLEESFGCDCDPDKNFPLDICLNDCFSKDWTSDVRRHMNKRLPWNYTMEDNYSSVYQKLSVGNLSTVCQYGNLSMASEAFRKFIAPLKGNHGHDTSLPLHDNEQFVSASKVSERSAVNSREVQLHMVKTALANGSGDKKLQGMLDAEIEHRRKIDTIMRSLGDIFYKEFSHALSADTSHGRTNGEIGSDEELQQCNVDASTADWDSDCYKSILTGRLLKSKTTASFHPFLSSPPPPSFSL